jgi:predicted metal-binding protein
MEKILIVGCKRTMDDVCIGCSRCMVAFNRRMGEFERYKDQEAELMGILNCGDCPGAAIVPRLAQIRL